ncbi:NAD-dependent epimerase/dehydratase family protein [Humibacillus xanthopallidus]|uniref:NAD-dependent epimerase/dehydratase family protein n=1 Tax=Humibacillus xanthopallidus TaxID=412689 RepID=UPI00384D3766
MVTGGTGFVGSHAVVGLLASGHEVRLLVRRPELVDATFAPHGLDAGRSPGDLVVGDVRDGAVIRRALEGCDAVVHAAAVFSVDPRRAAEVTATNVAATEAVLGLAVEAGCDPVVHVSSSVALTRFGPSGPDLPLGDLDLPYAASKVESERVARRLQETGAPVVTVYPGGVYGPHDPHLGDQGGRLVWIVRGRMPMWPAGGYHCVDVRDVAATMVRVMEPGHGPRRYVVPGHHIDGSELYGAVERAIGRKRPHLTLPKPVAGPVTAPINAVQSRLPVAWHYPVDREGVELLIRDTRLDDSRARVELGLEPRPWDLTIRDTITSLVDAGHLDERYRPAPSATIAG